MNGKEGEKYFRDRYTYRCEFFTPFQVSAKKVVGFVLVLMFAKMVSPAGSVFHDNLARFMLLLPKLAAFILFPTLLYS